MRGTLGVVVLIALSACAKQDSVQCDDGRTCPAGTVCSTERGGLCLSTAQTTACASLAQGDVCDAAGVPGICDNHLCLPGCGDGHVDSNEECDDSNFASHDGCSSACKVEIASWSLLPKSWTGVNLATAAYLPGLHRLVLVGGQAPDALTQRIWQRDPDPTKRASASAGWRDVTDLFAGQLPPARSDAAMTYDSSRGVIVLYGGLDPSGNNLDDTWEYGAPFKTVDNEMIGTWKKVATIGTPGRRSGMRMAFDAAHNKTVLFGGLGDVNVLSDTWTYDGTTATWSKVQTSAVTVSWRAAMAYDPTRQLVVLLGGDATGLPNRTWEFNGTDWALSSASGPARRQYASLAYDPSRAKIVLFGGRASQLGTDLSDTWTYDGTWQQIPFQANPPNREGATLTYDADAGELVLVSGSVIGGEVLRDTWQLTTTWAPSTPQFEPPVAASTSAAYRPKDHSLYVYGGFNRTVSGPLNDLWRFDGQQWTQLADGPFSRYDHAMTYDSTQDRIVVFGGSCTDEPGDCAQPYASDTTEVYDPNNNTWTTIKGTYPAALARYDSTIVYDEVARQFVMFGGQDNSTNHVPSDTWVLSGGVWTQELPDGTGPAATNRPAMAWDPIGKQIVLLDSAGTTWTHQAGTWKVAIDKSAGPPGRDVAGLSYDVQRKRFLLVSGMDMNGGRLTDTWELDPEHMVWTQLFVPGTTPLPRRLFGFGPVANAREQLLYGGYAGTAQPLGDVWTFRYRSQTPDELCNDGMDNDGDSQIDAADPDCATF